VIQSLDRHVRSLAEQGSQSGRHGRGAMSQGRRRRRQRSRSQKRLKMK
jgi:hypothetical protein